MNLALLSPKHGYYFLCCLTCFFGCSSVQAQSKEAADSVTPPQVYQEVRMLRDEVEQIRQYLGRRPPRERSFSLSGAIPRQTFFQAQTLFRKCNQLAQEIAGVSRERPDPAPDREIVPADVLNMVRASRNQLAYVKKNLGLTAKVDTPKLERRRTPSDVMREIIEVGYVLNRLVDERAEWSDIYDRVEQMIVYVGGALPSSSRYPELPEYECCKQPEDVYQHLAESLQAIGPVAESKKFGIVRITPKKRAEGGASVDTVYDLTTTMVSDFASITLLLGGEEEIDPPNYKRPQRILPADVYRLIVVLREQIKQLTPSTS